MGLRNFPGKSVIRPFRLGRKGQGTVEYILLLVVVIAVVIALTRVMYRPMDIFITKMMDEYLQCLLQTGELPVLGGEGGSATCMTPVYTPITAEGADGKNGGDDKKNGDVNFNSDKVSGGSRGGAGGVSTYARNKAGFKGSGFSVNNGSIGGDGGAGDSKKLEYAKTGDSSGFFNFGGGYGRYGTRSRYIALTGEVYEEVKKKQEKKNRAAGGTVVARDLEGGIAAVKRLEVKPPPKKEVDPDTNVKGFDFSKYIKIILISAIILVILLLVGGQALQLSKSWEKGE